jgi:hypothetical protein
MYKKGMEPPNGGDAYKEWVQGSPGGQGPMPLYSNEYSHTFMKHGQNDINPYRGNIKFFAPSVTNELRYDVNKCTHDTINPVGCQMAAIRKVYTHDAPTPHPMSVSYETGYRPGEVYIPPDVKYNW